MAILYRLPIFIILTHLIHHDKSIDVKIILIAFRTLGYFPIKFYKNIISRFQNIISDMATDLNDLCLGLIMIISQINHWEMVCISLEVLHWSPIKLWSHYKNKSNDRTIVWNYIFVKLIETHCLEKFWNFRFETDSKVECIQSCDHIWRKTIDGWFHRTDSRVRRRLSITVSHNDWFQIRWNQLVCELVFREEK